jgi:3-phenylpropionate/trans-cinnamate dioxygenase ferredoxin subunit
MPHWVRVANAADIPLNKSVAVEVAGHSLLIARLEDGFCALRNMCSHQAQPLQGGQIADGAIECPFHGARFDLRTGARLTMPAVRGVKAFSVRVEGGAIEIDEEKVIESLGAELD